MASPADILSWRMDKTNQTTWEPSDKPEPHSWLQDLAIAIEIVLPLLACVVIGLRCYIRVSTKTIGWGVLFDLLLHEATPLTSSR
jgi:hypothetical protein